MEATSLEVAEELLKVGELGSLCTTASHLQGLQIFVDVYLYVSEYVCRVHVPPRCAC